MKFLALLAFVVGPLGQEAPAPVVSQAAPAPASGVSATCLALRAEAVRLAESRVRRTEPLMAAMNASHAAVQQRTDEARSQARLGAAASAATGLASLIPGAGLFAGLVGTAVNTALSGRGVESEDTRAAETQMNQAQQHLAEGAAELARMQEVALQMQSEGC